MPCSKPLWPIRHSKRRIIMETCLISLAGYAPLDGSTGYKAPFDKQSDIYAAILNDLQWAVNNFSQDPEPGIPWVPMKHFCKMISLCGPNSPIVFGYILPLQCMIRTMQPRLPRSAMPLGKPLLGDGEDIGLWPAKISGLDFQWRQWSFSANCYLRMGSTMWNLMSANNNPDGSGIFDPRTSLFYETNNAGDWAAYPQNPTTSTPTEGGAPYNLQKPHCRLVRQRMRDVFIHP